jgi:hypothetical protein
VLFLRLGTSSEEIKTIEKGKPKQVHQLLFYENLSNDFSLWNIDFSFSPTSTCATTMTYQAVCILDVQPKTNSFSWAPCRRIFPFLLCELWRYNYNVHTQANNNIIRRGSVQHTDRKTITNNGRMNKSNTEAATIEIPIRGIRTRLFWTSERRP